MWLNLLPPLMDVAMSREQTLSSLTPQSVWPVMTSLSEKTKALWEQHKETEREEDHTWDTWGLTQVTHPLAGDSVNVLCFTSWVSSVLWGRIEYICGDGRRIVPLLWTQAELWRERSASSLPYERPFLSLGCPKPAYSIGKWPNVESIMYQSENGPWAVYRWGRIYLHIKMHLYLLCLWP